MDKVKISRSVFSLYFPDGECFEAIYLGAIMSEETQQKHQDISMTVNPDAFKLDFIEVVQ